MLGIARSFMAGARSAGYTRGKILGMGTIGAVAPLGVAAAAGMNRASYTFPDFPRMGLASGVRGIDAPQLVSQKIMTLQGRGSRLRRMIH